MSIGQMAIDAHRAIRTAHPELFVTVRTGGKTYQAMPDQTQHGTDAAAMGPLDSATGSLRLLLCEIQEPKPKASDDIEIPDFTAGPNAYARRTIIGTRTAGGGNPPVFFHIQFAAKDDIR
jgi:hypothetical protein